jgi:transposase
MNSRLRKYFIKKLDENGLKMKFVAEQLDIEYTTLSKWKNGHMDFGEDKFKKVRNFLEKL